MPTERNRSVRARGEALAVSRSGVLVNDPVSYAGDSTIAAPRQ
ncbi:hypothetical protein [Amycolatopsis tolypomycina]